MLVGLCKTLLINVIIQKETSGFVSRPSELGVENSFTCLRHF